MSGWRDAFDAQMGLWRWLRSEFGAGTMAVRLADNERGLQPESRGLIRALHGIEETKLENGDPIFVSAEMCELVAAAADPDIENAFQPEPLYVTDLPTQQAFLLFEKPFDVLDRFDEPLQIAGFSWTPLLTSPDGAVVQDGWTQEALDEALKTWGGDYGDGETGKAGGVALTVYAVTNKDFYRDRGFPFPPVEITHVTPWYFGMTFDGNELDQDGKPTGAGWWWRILQVTLRLMQQQISAKHSYRGPRQQRREAKRQDWYERETLVVRLRREKREPTEDEHGPANYSHRFIVSGHWRNQWYPASHEHRQIWISPYVKGDENLPLVIRPRRAMVWSR